MDAKKFGAFIAAMRKEKNANCNNKLDTPW